MKSSIITVLATAALFMCSAVAINAQDNTSQNQQPAARHHMRSGAMNNNNNETATGCLQQGGNGGSYTLAAQDGSTWQLTSGAMDLGKYVGKDVTVAGTDMRPHHSHVSNVSTAQESTQHGPMDVLDLSVNNESCQR